MTASPREQITDLQTALRAAEGYLLNAKIDLETGATKRTAITTIDGGLRMIRAALDRATESALASTSSEQSVPSS